MQTLQAFKAMPLKLIPFQPFENAPVTYRVIDNDEAMIAKVNGAENRHVVERMVQAFNDSHKMAKMHTLLKNRFIEICKQLKGSGQQTFMIRTNAHQPGRVDELIAELKDQLRDAPVELTSILGGEGVQILEIL